MVEIYNELNLNTLNRKSKTIEILKNNISMIGSSVSDCHRLLNFDADWDLAIYIDFVEYSLISSKFYFVPAKHILYLPDAIEAFYCIFIPNSSLNDVEQYAVLNLMYRADKSIAIENVDLFCVDTKLIIRQALYSTLDSCGDVPSSKYIQKATELVHLLLSQRLTYALTIDAVAAALCVTRKTLLRLCMAVFKRQPSEILRYHLYLKIVFKIIYYRSSSFAEIAEALEFSDPSSFGRYVKNISGLTPQEISKRYNHLLI